MSHGYRQDISLLVIDIDFFKKVNDAYGHSVGDGVLKEVAATIQHSIRTTDMLFRYGGEEFVVLLTNSDCDDSSVIADRILESVRDINMEVAGQKLDVSVSIGLACRNKLDNGTTLFQRADKAMYEAKNEGRDQLRVA